MTLKEFPKFHDQYREELRELAPYVGVPTDIVDDLPALVKRTQPWAKGDHVLPEHVVTVDPVHRDVVHGLYGAMGLKDERLLTAGQYDHLLVLGGVHLGNGRRFDLLRRMLDGNGYEGEEGVQAGRIVLLGGERGIFKGNEEVLIKQDCYTLQRRRSDNPWVQAVLRDEAPIAWESDLLRLAATVHLGDLSLQRTVHYPGEQDDYPEQTDLLWDERDQPVTLLHTKAVERNGQKRHTTQACMGHWLEALPPSEGARVGFITANPHLDRTTRVAINVLRQHGREDLQFEFAGSEAAAKENHQIYLGEIARNLYEDLQATQSAQV